MSYSRIDPPVTPASPIAVIKAWIAALQRRDASDLGVQEALKNGQEMLKTAEKLRKNK